ncbi:hypothetical protein [Streptomyces noursei]|uniref:hypothetical protein n=1 Tax=Streptomyces noursei TaxID=1971 RepID=UPI0023B8005D|nr:hypothetical protein [Streptomyces noursei]
MTTTATRKTRRTLAPAETERQMPDVADLVHYSPEEIAANRWLPFTARTLRDKAGAHQIPHSRGGGRITFTLRHVREIAAMYEVRPFRETKRAA